MARKNLYRKSNKSTLFRDKKFFFDKLEQFLNNDAIVTENNEIIKYKDFLKKIKIIENIIDKKRSRIFLLADNSYEFLVSYYAMLRKRSIIFLLNSKLEMKKIFELVKIYKPHFIFDCESLFDKKNNFHIVKTENKLQILKNKELINCENNYELAQLISTSGSMGSPKFVMQSFENIQTNTKDIVKTLKLNKFDKTITTMNPSYTYGLTKINTHIFVGGTIILNKKTVFDKEFWNKINMHGVTNFGGVPFFYEMLKRLNFHKFNFKNLKHITQAGGKLSSEILEYIYKTTKKFKIKLYIMYGQTEAGPRITIMDNKRLDKKIKSVGKPIGNNNLWLEDKKRNIIHKPNTVGELFCEGKNVMLGYAFDLSDLKKKKTINYINTGDLAYKDKDGFFYITGRTKRIIKPFGIRVDLQELEKYLESKNFFNCTCIGDDQKIHIYSKYNSKTNEIKKVVLNKLNLKKNIIYFFEENKIPRDSNGKIIYKI